MDKYEIVRRIEKFAPLETAEKWDCSGWLVETDNKDVNKIMFALTVTKDVFRQAKAQNCDMIISHHPLFEVPVEYKCIDMYCAHTNMDLANGGTTDTLIDKLKSIGLPVKNIIKDETFVRYIETDISFEQLCRCLSKISPNFRYTDKGTQSFKKLALCAGSGAEFIEDAFIQGADGYITGDLKFHTALDSPITVFDIGHFESEIQVLDVFANLLDRQVEIIYANEKSPFNIFMI